LYVFVLTTKKHDIKKYKKNIKNKKRHKNMFLTLNRMVQLPATAAIEYVAAWNEN